jgi:hypothetical protein
MITREFILQEANKAVANRGTDYGKPSENFDRIAELWGSYIGISFQAEDVGIMMMMVKISRIMETPSHVDSWVDIAGYAAITAEAIAEIEDTLHHHEDQQSTDSTTQD